MGQKTDYENIAFFLIRQYPLSSVSIKPWPSSDVSGVSAQRVFSS